jgi:CheY-like chemotaxis protein
MSQTIVARYGGTMSVDSQPGDGTIVRVRMPSADLPLAHAATPATIGELATGKRVLIVDGDPEVGVALAAILIGYDVTAVDTGAQALERLCRLRERYDVIFCELSLPDSTGREVYESVREFHPGEEARFVFMTADTFTPAMRAFLANIPNVCIGKPLEASVIGPLLGQPCRS